MPKTQIRGKQVLDDSIQRDDLDVGTPSQAVIRKIIAGTNVTISYTGADSGTGDVTVNASGGGGGTTSFATLTKFGLGGF